MSTLGPPVVIPAPDSGAPAVSLLRSALVHSYETALELDDAVNGLDGGESAPRAATIDARWGNGIEFQPESCANPLIFDPCASAVLDDDGNRPATRSYDPFVVDAYDRCSTFGWEAADYEARARRLLARVESEAVANELWTGELAQFAGNNNPYFQDGTADTVGTALSPHNGLAALVQAIADDNGGVGMIHMRPRLLQMLASNAFLRWENGQWYTAAGNKVVADAGYPGTGPAGQAITNVSNAITEWAFATELVEVHRGPVKVPGRPNTYETVQHESNNEVVRAQRMYAPIWNGCVLAAVSITTPAVD